MFHKSFKAARTTTQDLPVRSVYIPYILYIGYSPGITTKEINEDLEYNNGTTNNVLSQLRKRGYCTSTKGRHYLTEHGIKSFKAFADTFKPSLDAMLKEIMKEVFRQRNEHIKNGTTPA